MKNTVNFTDYLNNSLKREPSLKSTAHLKMGLTVNAFHANSKTGKKHTRTKTDQFCPGAETMSTTSIFMQGKLKSYQQQRKPRKKTQSQLQLKKANSYKLLDSANQFKSCAIYKPTNPQKQSRSETQTQTIRSLQKIRKNILNQTNPELAHEELKQLNAGNKKNTTQATVTNQYFLLSSQLLETIKKMQKKHKNQINTQKQIYERRENKLVQKILDIEKKNQRCTTLINQLRMRNIDVDGVWHDQKLNTKVSD